MKKNTPSPQFLSLDRNAQLKGQWFGRTVINSDERFAYEEAQHIIETKQGKIPADISIREGAYSVPDNVVQATLDIGQARKNYASSENALWRYFV